jgi:hypothetical protein
MTSQLQEGLPVALACASHFFFAEALRTAEMSSRIWTVCFPHWAHSLMSTFGHCSLGIDTATLYTNEAGATVATVVTVPVTVSLAIGKSERQARCPSAITNWWRSVQANEELTLPNPVAAIATSVQVRFVTLGRIMRILHLSSVRDQGIGSQRFCAA